MATAQLIPKPGHEGTYHVDMQWGDAFDTPSSEDVGAVMDGYASVTWLGRIEGITPSASFSLAAEAALDDFFD